MLGNFWREGEIPFDLPVNHQEAAPKFRHGKLA